MGAPYNFETKARIPVRPLSYDNKENAVPKELVIDYENCCAYVCDVDGNIVDIGANPNTINEICKYLKENPELITKNITIRVGDNDVSLESILLAHETTINEINENYNKINETIEKNKKDSDEALTKAVQDLTKELEKYLKLTGGTLTGKLGITIGNSIYATDGEGTMTMIYVAPDGTVHIGDADTKKISLNGPIILDPENYGTEVPSNGVEGQLFFKLL